MRLERDPDEFSNGNTCRYVFKVYLVNLLPSHLPVEEMQEMWVQCLGREDPMEKEMATHSSILTWKTPWTEEPGGLQSTGSQRVTHD